MPDLGLIGTQDFKGHCSKCGQAIIGNTATTYTRDGVKYVFHQECFLCEMCTTRIDNKPFYLHEGRHICSECYMGKVLGRCDDCGLPFVDSTIVKAGGKQHHPGCFKCSKCTKQLTEKYIEKDGKFMCK
eukprot:jgi/Hompol1/2992/HPOL_006282-RA